MTRDQVLSWTERVLGPSETRRLLLLDHNAAHRVADDRAALDEQDVDLVLVPAGCTALAQPIDIVKPFKDRVRDSWVTWMVEPRPPTAAGNLRQPTRQNVVNWVGRAWDGVGCDVITKAFLRCGVSNALDGSGDDQILEWFPEEIGVALPHDGDAAAAAEENASDASLTSDEESPASDSDEAM
ncbi:hypothetical protein V1264_001336 [Littorina saxatilis]|uniref:DDE-1 domain-containing protein n=1 Tax=Littorina saxatilis TaxID=31220 RepID=A0AAN9C2C9_9CAEN